MSSIARLFLSALLSWSPALAQDTAPGDPIATLAAMPVEPAAANGQRVVVQDAGGQPVAAAIVVFAPSDAGDAAARSAAAERWFPGDEPLALAHRVGGGIRYQVDERGTTRVPARAGRLFAMHAGQFASAELRRDAGGPAPRVLLQLAPVAEFTAEVVDAAGAPAAGVRVAVVLSRGGAVSMQTHTDQAGRGRFRMFDSRPSTAMVQLEVATREPVVAPLPRGDSALVRLQLPRLVALSVQVKGELLPGDEVKWQLQQGGRRVRADPGIGATAMFAVEPGFEGSLRVSVNALSFDVPLPGIEATATPPVEWTAPAKPGRVVLRLLDATGVPVVRAQVRCQWHYQNGGTTHAAFTNAEGWLTVNPPDRAPKEASLRLVVPTAGGAQTRGGTCIIDYRRDGDTAVQLGEQRLTTMPIAVAGTMVDADGKPLPGVRCRLNDTRVETGVDGTFQLRLPEPLPATVALALDTPDWFFREPAGRSTSLAKGEGHRLVLQPAGRVLVGLDGLPTRLWSGLDFQVEPASGDGVPIPLDLDLPARSWNLPAGHWDLVILHGEREVHRIPGLQIAAGIENHDARCMSLDWRQFAALATIRVEDQHGKPTSAAMVCHLYGPRNQATDCRSVQRGIANLLVPKAGAMLQVRPADQELPTIDLGQVTGEHVVRLGRGPRLRLELSALPTLPPGGQLLLVVGDDHDGVAFDAKGGAEHWLPAVGDCSPRVVLRVDAVRQVVWQGAGLTVGGGGSVLPVDVLVVQRAIDMHFPR